LWGVYLADHHGIFASPERREKLIVCLESSWTRAGRPLSACFLDARTSLIGAEPDQAVAELVCFYTLPSVALPLSCISLLYS
jgi:hypothetical protein